MRFDPKKSFGYPVLRQHSDDYVEAGFTTSVELVEVDNAGKQGFNADYLIMVGVPEIRDAIREGKAQLVISLFCSKTYYSETLITNDLKGHKAVDLAGVRGDLQINAEIVVATDEFELRADKIHPEFGGSSAKFKLRRGDVLAQAAPLKVFIERELFKPLEALFRWTEDLEAKTGQWKMDWSGDYVNISTSKEQLRLFSIWMGSDLGKAILMNSVFMPAMAKLIEQVVAEPESEELWAKTIIQKLSNINVDVDKPHLSDESLTYAQLLLQQPLKRLNAHMISQD